VWAVVMSRHIFWFRLSQGAELS